MLLSLLEGVSSKRTFMQFGKTLELEVLQRRMAYVYRKCMEDADQDPLSIVSARNIDEEIYFGDLNEAFGIYMLMATLSTYSEEALAAINPLNYNSADRVAVEFFTLNAGCIEIKWGERLERVYFPIPPVCSYLTEASRQKILWGVSRESPGEKMQGFFTMGSELIEEMTHLEKMSKYRALSFLTANFEGIKDAMLYISFLINFFLVFDMRVHYDDRAANDQKTKAWDTPKQMYESVGFRTDWIEWAVLVLGIMQSVLTCFVAIGVLYTHGPLAVSSGWSEKIRMQGKPPEDEPEPEDGSVEKLLLHGPEEAGIDSGEASLSTRIVYYYISLGYIVGDVVVKVHMLFFFLSIAANVVTPFFHACHLLDLVYKSETLGNVLKAVTHNAQQLIMTFVLALIIVYFYSILAMLVVRNNFFQEEDFPFTRACDTMLTCFFTITREGIINGGGPADYLPGASLEKKQKFYIRFFFDLSFFVLVVIVLLNVIFGIIIDTFASLREQMEATLLDMKSTCFMCSIDKQTFDRQGTPFDIHIKKEHNMWQYLYYLVYLNTKDPTEYTGLESYVGGMIEEEDVGFYPVNKSLCLDADDEEEDPFQVETSASMDTLKGEISTARKQLMTLKSESSSQQFASVDFNKRVMARFEDLAKQHDAIIAELRL